MKNWFGMIWNWLKAFWWVVVLVVLAALGGWLIIRRRSDGKVGREPVVMPLTIRVAENIRVAVTDAKVERAVIKTKSDIERREIEEVRKEPDGKKRREKLAAILAKSI